MKYAGMYVIKLLPADVFDYSLEEGDQVDIEQMPLINNQKIKRRKTKN